MKYIIEYGFIFYYMIMFVIADINEEYNKSYFFMTIAFIILAIIEIRKVKDLLKEKKCN